MTKKCHGRKSGIASLALCVLAAHSPALAAPPKAAVAQVQIIDETMCCGGCARNVSAQLYATRGVRDVVVDLESHTVTVSLPAPTPAMLGQLWHAVEKGKGIPTKLVTAEATYTLVRPAIDQAEQSPAAGAPIVVTIDNMHCQGCANKIAGQISTLKGVTKVSIDMEGGLLVVETSRNIQLSPWAVIDAVAKANERPLAVVSSQGEMTIEWVAEAAPKDHEQAQQPRSEGIQR